MGPYTTACLQSQQFYLLENVKHIEIQFIEILIQRKFIEIFKILKFVEIVDSTVQRMNLWKKKNSNPSLQQDDVGYHLCQRLVLHITAAQGTNAL